jgi:hypothetical protein
MRGRKEVEQTVPELTGLVKPSPEPNCQDSTTGDSPNQGGTNEEEHPYQGIVRMLEDSLRFKGKGRREHLYRIAPLVFYYGRQLPSAPRERLYPVAEAMLANKPDKALDLVWRMIWEDEDAKDGINT